MRWQVGRLNAAMLIAAVFFIQFNCGFAQSTTIVNPILAGLYPDPSVLRVGSDYLINSAFAYFPGIHVFHSQDLNNRKQVGNGDNTFLSTQVAGGFIGCVFGMYATSSGEQTGNTGSFAYLKYQGNDSMYK